MPEPPSASPPHGPRTPQASARAFAQRWATLPHLSEDEAAAFAEDIRLARESLGMVSAPELLDPQMTQMNSKR